MRPDNNQSFVAHYRKSDGKPQSVLEHLEGASRLSSEFAGKLGLSSLGALAGLLHDMGKYSAAFQAYIESAIGKPAPSASEGQGDAEPMKSKIDHSSAGAQLVWQALSGNQSPVRSLSGQMIALCIASHHSRSGLIDCLSPNGEDAFGERMAKRIEPTCRDDEEEYVRSRVTDLLASSSIEDELGSRLGMLGSGERSPVIDAFKLGLLTRFLFSALIDADRLNTADFENEAAALARYNGDYPDWAVLAERLEARLAKFEIRNQVDEIRREVSSACLSFARKGRGLYQLTVPTGGGKTLASLRFALGHVQAQERPMDRIIYVAPYTSILDQNASDVRSALEQGDSGKQIVLEHHSNLTQERDTWQSQVLSQNWDAPIVFTTAVQLLETLFGSGTRGVRRMHQLANAVIIFDEAQTIPVKAIHLFNNAINFLVDQCGSTVVLCTATQPLLDKVDASKGAARLSPDPQMMPDVEALFRDLRRVEVIDVRKSGGWTEDEIAATALREMEIAEAAQKKMKSAGSALVVVNTRAHAKEIYLRCKAKTGDVFHLSTRMCPAHRMEVLGAIQQRLDPDDPKPVICVSTQLIEAGIDIDFGSVIRCLAGLDSIAQAAGRCNRNGRPVIGRVLVVNPSHENLDKLPDIRKAQEISERVLGEFRDDPAAFDHDLLSPKAMARYYQYYFFERAHEMAYPVSPRDIGRDDTLLSLLSTNKQAVNAYKRAHKAGPPLHLRQSFKAAAEAFQAIDSPTEGIIVPYGEEGERIIAELSASIPLGKRSELLKQAQRYSVNLFAHEIGKLKEARALYDVGEGSGVYSLDSRYYSDEFGVSLEQVAPMKPLIG